MKHRWIANLDMYRKVPIDLLEGSRQGSAISWMALFVIATLFFIQTKAFFTNGVETVLALDADITKETLLRVNFNITLMDLKCEFANLNVVSVFGGKQHSHTAAAVHISKFAVDSKQIRRQYMDRNMQQHDIDLHDHAVTASVEQMVEEKQRQDAVDLSPDELEIALTQHMFVFVDMFAGWCSHCRVRTRRFGVKKNVLFKVCMEQYALNEQLAPTVGFGADLGKVGRSGTRCSRYPYSTRTSRTPGVFGRRVSISSSNTLAGPDCQSGLRPIS
jgi:hypothetical protein